jgi:hypothetical protein
MTGKFFGSCLNKRQGFYFIRSQQWLMSEGSETASNADIDQRTPLRKPDQVMYPVIASASKQSFEFMINRLEIASLRSQ